MQKRIKGIKFECQKAVLCKDNIYTLLRTILQPTWNLKVFFFAKPTKCAKLAKFNLKS